MKQKLKRDDFTFSYLLSKILENSTSEETMKYSELWLLIIKPVSTAMFRCRERKQLVSDSPQS